MLPSLVVPSAHRLPGTGVVPGTAGRPPSASAGGWASWYRPGPYGCLTASGQLCSRHVLTAPYRPLALDTQAGPSPGDSPRVEGKIIDRGPYMDLRHRMDSH
jgi:rare lipoprotein A (peptidoglycan hydrolase)